MVVVQEARPPWSEHSGQRRVTGRMTRQPQPGTIPQPPQRMPRRGDRVGIAEGEREEIRVDNRAPADTYGVKPSQSAQVPVHECFRTCEVLLVDVRDDWTGRHGHRVREPESNPARATVSRRRVENGAPAGSSRITSSKTAARIQIRTEEYVIAATAPEIVRTNHGCTSPSPFWPYWARITPAAMSTEDQRIGRSSATKSRTRNATRRNGMARFGYTRRAVAIP